MPTDKGLETVKLEITEDNFYNEDNNCFSDHYSVHDALPYAILDHLKDQNYLNNVFGLNKPNRVITEGENTESWYNTEDWAITSSEKEGKIIIGQTVSHRESKQTYGGTPLEIIQARNFERRIRSTSDRAYNHLEGIYTVSVNHEKNSVEELERKVKNAIDKTGSAEIGVIVKELDKAYEDSLGEACSILAGD